MTLVKGIPKIYPSLTWQENYLIRCSGATRKVYLGGFPSERDASPAEIRRKITDLEKSSAVKQLYSLLTLYDQELSSKEKALMLFEESIKLLNTFRDMQRYTGFAKGKFKLTFLTKEQIEREMLMEDL